MNRPDKAGEPSMEEILASIRQIIADEPSNDLPDPVIEANPLVPQSSSVKTPDTRVPLADRLSGVLKDGPLPPTSPFGSKRPLSFDQDLADMLDARDPLNGSGIAAPKPDLRIQPGLATPHPMVSKSFVPATPAYVPPSSIDDLATRPVTESVTPSVAAAEPVVAAPPLGNLDPTVAAAPSPPVQTYGFPPLRKSGFYPPQPKTPVTPKAPLGGAPSVSSAGPAPATDSDMLVTPASIDDALRRIDSGLGGFVSSTSGAGAANAAFGTFSPTVADATPAFGSQMHDPMLDAGAARRDAPEVRPSFVPAPEPQPSAPPYSFTPAPSFGQEPAPAAAPAYSSFGSTASQQPFVGPAPNAFGAFDGRPADVRPVEPRAYPDPFATSTRPHSGFNGHYGAEPMSADAAHSALDALAQGLAASAGHASEAIPLITPIIDVVPEADVRSPPPASPSMLPAMVSPVGSMPVNRTLEDAVADMLRPMLQQWVADNMPRIIEKALRSEVEKTLKPGQK